MAVEVLGVSPSWVAVNFDESRKAFPGEQLSGSVLVSIPTGAAPGRTRLEVVGWGESDRSSAECWIDVTPGGTIVDELATAPPPRLALVPTEVTMEQGSPAASQFTLIVNNPGSEPADYRLSVEGWTSAWYSLESAVGVAPGKARDCVLNVRPPGDTTPGQYRFKSRVELPDDPATDSEVSGVLEVVPPPPPEVAVEPSTVTFPERASEERRLQVTVTNSGLVERDYAVAVSGPTSAWSAPPVVLRVPAAERMQTELRMRVPPQAAPGTHPFSVRAAVADFDEVAAVATGEVVVVPAGAAPGVAPARASGEASGRANAAAGELVALRPEASLAPTSSFRFSRTEDARQVLLHVRNPTRGEQDYEITIRGVPDGWYSLVTTEITLGPGASSQVPIRLHPAPDAESPPGDYTLEIRVAPRGFPGAAAEIIGSVSVAPELMS